MELEIPYAAHSPLSNEVQQWTMNKEGAYEQGCLPSPKRYFTNQNGKRSRMDTTKRRRDGLVIVAGSDVDRDRLGDNAGGHRGGTLGVSLQR
jgi:hypothetical protein